MKQSRRTRKPSHSSRGGLLDNQVSVLMLHVSNLAGISSPGGRHCLTSVIWGIIKVSGRR
jgi:hypothetical protein